MWPFVFRSSFNEVMKDNCRLAESEYQLRRENFELRRKLAKAEKNDHRDPVTGKFTKG